MHTYESVFKGTRGKNGLEVISVCDVHNFSSIFNDSLFRHAYLIQVDVKYVTYMPQSFLQPMFQTYTCIYNIEQTTWHEYDKKN